MKKQSFKQNSIYENTSLYQNYNDNKTISLNANGLYNDTQIQKDYSNLKKSSATLNNNAKIPNYHIEALKITKMSLVMRILLIKLFQSYLFLLVVYLLITAFYLTFIVLLMRIANLSIRMRNVQLFQTFLNMSAHFAALNCYTATLQNATTRSVYLRKVVIK